MTDSRQLITSIGINKEQISTNSKNINNLIELAAGLRKSVSILEKEINSSSGTIIQGGAGGGGGGGSTSLAGLTDTSIANNADNHLLQYNGTTQIWENTIDLTLPGTLTCPNAASFGAISGSVLSLAGQAFFMNGQHEILADVKFRGDTYIQKTGQNGAVGFYCNTLANPPRVGIGTVEQDDTLTVKGGFGIRSGTAANSVVPLLTANSAFGKIVTNGEMNDADGSYLATFNNSVSIQEDLKVVGRLQLGATADAGDINYIVASTGPNTAPRWVDHRQQTASFVLLKDLVNSTTPKQLLPWSAGAGGNFWEEKASTQQGAVPAYLAGKIYHSTNLTYNHVQLVGTAASGSLIQLAQGGKYRITTRVTFEVRPVGGPPGAPALGQKQNIELREITTNTLLERFDFYYQTQEQIIIGKGECIVRTPDNPILELSINCSIANAVILFGAMTDPEKAGLTYINIERIDDFP